MDRLAAALPLTRDQVSVWEAEASRNQSTYSELTDSPNATRRIVSASNSATDNCRMRGQDFAAAES